jgi:hypothetical protein
MGLIKVSNLIAALLCRLPKAQAFAI